MATVSELVERMAANGADPVKALCEAKPEDATTWTPEMRAFVEGERKQRFWQSFSTEDSGDFRRVLMEDAVYRACVGHWAKVSVLLDTITERVEKGSELRHLVVVLDGEIDNLAIETCAAAFKVAEAIDGLWVDPETVVQGLAELARETPAEDGRDAETERMASKFARLPAQKELEVLAYADELLAAQGIESAEA